MKPRDIVPVVFVLKAASGAGDARNVVLSGEMQMLDPKDNVIAAAVSTGTSDKAISQKPDITWADLESITNNWARGLRKGLDDARGVAPKS